MIKRIIKKLVLSVLSLVLMVVFVELGIRLLVPSGATHGWPVPDQRYGFRNQKNFEQMVWYPNTNITWTVQINSLGLRGPELDFDNQTALRILLLGDSFTFGYGLNREESFAGRLEAMFEEAGREVMVINAGVAGWGTSQQLVFARDNMALFRPDVVILSICENDPVDDRIFAEGLAGGILPSFPGKRFLRDNFSLYSMVYERVYIKLYSMRMSTEIEKTADGVTAVASDEIPEKSLPGTEFWGNTIRQIQAFREDLSAMRPGSMLLVQLTEFWKPEIRESLGGLDNGKDLIVVDLHARMGGIPVEQLYLDYDPHWNARMHNESAEALYEAITNTFKRIGVAY